MFLETIGKMFLVPKLPFDCYAVFSVAARAREIIATLYSETDRRFGVGCRA